MADRKISDLTALTTPASGDYLPIVDISEASAANKNKRITIEELLRGAPDGTAGAPGIAFESDPNTGIYRPGADQVAISTNGTGRLFVDSDGKVGLATSIPQAYFDLVSNVRGVPETSGSTTTVTSLRVRGASNGVLDIGELSSATAGSYWMQVRDRTDLGFEYNLALQPNGGNVGVGTTSPQGLCDIAGSNGRLVLTNGNTSNGMKITATNAAYSANGYLAFEGYSSEYGRFDSSGRLLVGTASDSGGALLQVNDNRIRIATAKTPASASDTGTTGEVCWDASYIYVCTATNTWKRAALSAW